MKILFVCQANVGRSQMAEAFYNFYTKSRNARSAGVEDFREKYHYQPTTEIIGTMMEKGINISNQRIDFLTPKMIDEVEQVVVLCAQNLCPPFLINSSKAVFREVQDPHQQNESIICQIRDQIEDIILDLIADNENIHK
jgi:arsenate reductase